MSVAIPAFISLSKTRYFWFNHSVFHCKNPVLHLCTKHSSRLLNTWPASEDRKTSHAGLSSELRTSGDDAPTKTTELRKNGCRPVKEVVIEGGLTMFEQNCYCLPVTKCKMLRRNQEHRVRKCNPLPHPIMHHHFPATGFPTPLDAHRDHATYGSQVAQGDPQDHRWAPNSCWCHYQLGPAQVHYRRRRRRRHLHHCQYHWSSSQNQMSAAHVAHYHRYHRSWSCVNHFHHCFTKTESLGQWQDWPKNKLTINLEATCLNTGDCNPLILELQTSCKNFQPYMTSYPLMFQVIHYTKYCI